MIRIFKANITRDGEHWMIDIPELAAQAVNTETGQAINLSTATQAETVDDILTTAYDFVSTVTGLSEGDFIVSLHFEGVLDGT